MAAREAQCGRCSKRRDRGRGSERGGKGLSERRGERRINRYSEGGAAVIRRWQETRSEERGRERQSDKRSERSRERSGSERHIREW